MLAAGLALAGAGWRLAAQETKAPDGLAEVRLRLLRQDARLLEAAAAADLHRRLDPVFAGLDSRIPAFADWAFRWRTGFVLMRSQIWAAVTHPVSGGGRGLSGSLRAAAEQEVGVQFDALVLHGAATEPLLHDVWRQWRAGLDATLAEVRLDHALALGMGIGAARLPTPADVSGAPDTRAAATLDSAATDTLQTRGGRPVLSRLIVRSPALIPAARVGEVVEAATGVFLAGSAAVMATAIGATLGFDFLVSRVDERANRSTFERQVREGLARERAELERRWMAEAGAAIERGLAPMAKRLAAQPLQASN